MKKQRWEDINNIKNKHKKSKSFYDCCNENLPKEIVDKIMSRWDDELNIDKNGNVLSPHDITYGSRGFNNKGYWFKCLDHPEHSSEQKHIVNLIYGNGGGLRCNQCNIIAITHPELIKYLVNIEDAYNYSLTLNSKIFAKCPNCGFKRPIRIYDIINKIFPCPKCSDGVPYPEKFMFNVLEQLSFDFTTQLSKMILKWCNNYKYDFYIDNKISCIIETHGLQHYEESKKGWRSKLFKIQENDKNKEQLAKLNGIENYIILDCRYSELEWIKNSIMNSELPKLLNFKEDDIDWLKCHEYACSSLVKTVCGLWNGDIGNIRRIYKELKITRPTTIKYLKQGTELGWCNYDPKEEIKKRNKYISKKILCLTTKEVFESITEASSKYKISKSNISQCCLNIVKSAGKHPETGEKMVWVYANEVNIDNDIQIEKILNNAQNLQNKKIICLTTKEVFNSISEAKYKYNLKNFHIGDCCAGKRSYTGRHPETKDKLVWMFYEEYIKKTQNEIELMLNNVKDKKIICVTTKEIFKDITNALDKYKIKYKSHIIECCRGKRNSVGKSKETGELLKWMYYDEYVKHKLEE